MKYRIDKQPYSRSVRRRRLIRKTFHSRGKRPYWRRSNDDVRFLSDMRILLPPCLAEAFEMLSRKSKTTKSNKKDKFINNPRWWYWRECKGDEFFGRYFDAGRIYFATGSKYRVPF